MAKKQSIFDFFWFLQKLSKRLKRNFLQTFYAILESHMFNGIKIVWLWGEKWAKFSPKMVKKQSLFDFFRFSRKLSIPFERFFYSHSTSYYCPLCAISLNSDGWDVRNIAKIKRRGTKNQPVFDYFDFHKNCPFDSNEFLYSPSTLYYGLLGVASSRLNCCDVNNITKVSPKMAKK